jgi:hypothetical protein
MIRNRVKGGRPDGSGENAARDTAASCETGQVREGHREVVAGRTAPLPAKPVGLGGGQGFQRAHGLAVVCRRKACGNVAGQRGRIGDGSVGA